jgi:hypothetical protein
LSDGGGAGVELPNDVAEGAELLPNAGGAPEDGPPNIWAEEEGLLKSAPNAVAGTELPSPEEVVPNENVVAEDAGALPKVVAGVLDFERPPPFSGPGVEPNKLPGGATTPLDW